MWLTLGIEKQLVALQSLLESGRHECISWSRIDEDLEVDPEEQEVKEEWDDDEADDPIGEMSVEICLSHQLVPLTDLSNLPWYAPS